MMREGNWSLLLCAAVLVPAFPVFAGHSTAGQLNLGPEEFVQADGVDIVVPSYSVPSFVYWDGDDLKDLVVGEKTTTSEAKVRVYLNVGTASNPQFSDYSYAQQFDGQTLTDLTCTPSGCLGCFPRVVYWDADTRKDLLVGQADGTVKIFLNNGTEESPTFDGGTLVQVSVPDSDLDVGYRATPTTLDWNNDGKMDLVVGGLDGKIHLYINCGCGGAIPPSFFTSPVGGVFAQEDGADLVVPATRSSPVVLDLDNNGKKDLLTGNTNGQLLFYRNVGTDAAPSFSGYEYVQADGVNIGLPGLARSRPFVCDWTGNGLLDVLIGGSDGKVRLYQGTCHATIVSWRSVRYHGGPVSAELAIVLDAAASGSAAVSETRRGGIQKIEADLTASAFPSVTGAIVAEDMDTHGTFPADDPPTVIDYGDGDYTLVIEWTGGLPDEACYRIDLAGTLSCQISGDSDCMVRGLTGDTNGDGNANLIDMAQAKSKNGSPVSGDDIRFDVNTDGRINLIDMALVKSLNGGATSCP